MRIISRNTLGDYWRRHRETEQPLRDWLSAARDADWSSMADIKRTYPKASVINNERVVFDICGGNYRLVVAVKFSAKIVFIKFIGTHKEYQKVDAATVARY
ncbi:MAG: type II toxin-antitoxin system HigB family toxin [Alphaproteobacteria bacterium]|jgi:mRNA interferase HigB